MRYTLGQQIAHYTITELPTPDIHPPRYRARCTCGNVSLLSERALYNAGKGLTEGCPKCVRDIRIASGMTQMVTRRDCRVCDDCPALRPSDGSPCKCGANRHERKSA